jgi:sulfate permease, SulP family
MLHHLVSRLKPKDWFQCFEPARLFPSLTAGLVIGMITIVMEVALGVLIFSGDLSEYASYGVGFMLFGTVVITVIVALMSSFPGAIAVPQDGPGAILGLIATVIVSDMCASTQPETMFLTVIATIGLTSLCTGVCLFILGQFKLGDLIRFIPYPVIGGFLAGTGWLLVCGSFRVMVATPLKPSSLAVLIRADVLVRWLPGAILAVMLFAMLKRFRDFRILPGIFVCALFIFYGELWLQGRTVNEVAARGWLLGPFPKGPLWQPFTATAVQQVNWVEILQQFGNIATIFIVSAVSLLLNASGLELIVKHDIDLNRELQAAGVANMAAGLGGSMVGFHTMSLSALGYKMGANSRLVGLVVGSLCAVTLFLDASLLSFFPRPVVGGLLMSLGLNLLHEWLYNAWFRLSRADYFIVLLILIVIGGVGFLEGVAVGIVAAVVLFVINYSQITIVKNEFSGASYQSHLNRPPSHCEELYEQGGQIYILKLQGFIFFGTANRLFVQVRQRADDGGQLPLHYVILDFRHVTGLDSSALHSFAKMKSLAEERGITFVFSHLKPAVQTQLARGGLDAHNPSARLFPDLDHALEWCENRILAIDTTQTQTTSLPLPKQLEGVLSHPALAARLMAYLERQTVEAGYELMHQGDAATDLFFIESGQATVQFELEDGQTTLRLGTMGPGTVVGEVGLYTGDTRSASVIADQPMILYRLTLQALRRMQQHDPDVTAEFQQFIIRLLAKRLARNVKIIRALMD